MNNVWGEKLLAKIIRNTDADAVTGRIAGCQDSILGPMRMQNNEEDFTLLLFHISGIA
jgi:hypothetical protein